MRSLRDRQLQEISSQLEFFIEIQECPVSSLKTMNNEKLKNCFRVASNIESVMNRLVELENGSPCSDIIRRILNSWGMDPNLDLNLMRKCCDVLLEKFFTDTEHSVLQTEVAVRIYTSMLPFERYEEFIRKLLMESASYKAIEDFIFENENLDIKTLRLRMFLHELVVVYRQGKTSGLVTSLQSILSPHKVENFLHSLIGIIALTPENLEEGEVRGIILREVLDQMFGRSILSKTFWLTLFQIDQTVFVEACVASEEFHVSVCNFLVYVGCMMDMVEIEGRKRWIPNLTTSICPEFTYDHLKTALKPLLRFVKREITLQKILIAEEETHCLLWRHLLQIL